MDVTKPYKFIRFGAMDATKPYKFTGFGAMDATKPYKFIGFGATYTEQHTSVRWRSGGRGRTRASGASSPGPSPGSARYCGDGPSIGPIGYLCRH